MIVLLTLYQLVAIRIVAIGDFFWYKTYSFGKRLGLTKPMGGNLRGSQVTPLSPGRRLRVAILTCRYHASASSHHPTSEFAQFAECPLSHPQLVFCVYSESKSGFFTMGKKPSR